MTPIVVSFLVLTVFLLAKEAQGLEQNLPKRYHTCYEKFAAGGPCEAFIPSWSYNWRTAKCEKFIFGGCEGSGNRFSSANECSERCERPGGPPLFKQTKNKEPVKIIEHLEPISTIVTGRPFPVDGKYRTAGSEAHSGLDHEQPWRMGEAPSICPHNPLNEEIGRYWLHQAEAEHASVASFARHTLQLMALGAPARLLLKSQEASIDEIQHAKICYGFASAFLGSDLGPGSLDAEGSLGSMEVKEVIRSLITEGCVGETLSALEVHLAAKYAEDPAVKTALAQIALDETRHSQLAWDTIQWILEKFPDTQSFAEEVFNAELEDRLEPARNDTSQQAAVFCQQSEKEASFHRYGLLQFRQTVSSVVFPTDMDAKRPYLSEIRQIWTLTNFFSPHFFVCLLILKIE